MEEFAGKVAVITGASSGIGLAAAHRLAAAGAQVILAARRKEELEKAQKGVGHNSLICPCDISKVSAIDALVQFTKEKCRTIDILVASAGHTDFTHISQVTEELFDELIATDYKGTFFTVQRFLPLLNPGASVLLLSSVAAHMGLYSHSVYASAKAAIKQLAVSFAIDLVDKGIRVNSISPGPIDTPMLTERALKIPGLREAALKMVPMKRYGKSEEVAELILFLSREVSSFITGTDFLIDGGFAHLRTAPS